MICTEVLLAMNEVEDDNWVREFNVSNPQKTHAGYTVYRVSSKVYPKGYPEAASEVIVFKRYSEFRALYKELMVIYETKSVEKKKFPRFAKGHYFDRFDESVIEERQKQALALLVFAGSISFLFTSQPFVQFFEGGVKHHSSRTSSHDSGSSPEQTDDVDEPSNEIWIPQMYFSEKQDSSDDETIYNRDDMSFDIEKDEKAWLARAMTLCSEGDDIETLASEAGITSKAEIVNEATSDNCLITTQLPDDVLEESQGSIDMLPTLLESFDGDEDVFTEIHSPRNETSIDQEDDNCDVCQLEISSKESVSSTVGESATDSETTLSRDNYKLHKQLGHSVSNIAMVWIDPKKKDYLYQAAQMIQQALYCEANEMYEEAFNKYKVCVGILLNGVQHDSDGKRREAVRRKTAQYLVKAEFLFNTYLKHDGNDLTDLSVMPSRSSLDVENQPIINKQFGHVTLASLKVIGVLGKNMLVECAGLEGVYVVKVLHKTNAVHRSTRQDNRRTNKSLSKKYVKSRHMVALHCHFETQDSIFLLLEFAAGGCLWSQAEESRCHLSKGSWSVENIAKSESEETSFAKNSVPRSKLNSNPEIYISTTLCKHTVGLLPSGNDSSDGPNEQNTCFKKQKSSLDCNKTGQTCLPVDTTAVFDYVIKDYAGANKHVQRWIAELVLAINSLHSYGIILKDLKPSNVLLDENGCVQLSYFGIWEEVDHSVDPEAVKQLYCAPEICHGEKILPAADWWSLGVLSYELITGKTLCATHPWGVYPHSCITFPSDDVSTEARSFLTGLICHNSQERLGGGLDGVEGIKSHAFFQGVDWGELMQSG